ncbi:MAG: alpha/beta hydrolase [Candidatus Paceibacterota bacterium]
MKRVIIVHQWMAGAEADWRPWLKNELVKQGYEVLVPDMPEIDTPVIDKWVNHLSTIVGIPDENTIFIGHSIGCQAILRYLETIDVSIGGAIFVAGWFTLTGMEDEEVEKIAEPWIKTPINFERIKEVLPKSIAILSDNDPYVPLESTRMVFEKELDTKVTVIPNGGHITADDGFTELPQVLSELQKL